MFYNDLEVNVNNIITQSFAGKSPAKLLVSSGVIVLNDWFKDLEQHEQKFILKHEEGHYVLNTDSELLADEYAFNQLKNQEFQSLKNIISTLFKNLSLHNLEHQKRIKNMTINIAFFDAFFNNNKKLLQFIFTTMNTDIYSKLLADFLKANGINSNDELMKLPVSQREQLLKQLTETQSFVELIALETKENYFSWKGTIAKADGLMDKVSKAISPAVSTLAKGFGIPVSPELAEKVMSNANVFNVADKMVNGGKKKAGGTGSAFGLDKFGQKATDIKNDTIIKTVQDMQVIKGGNLSTQNAVNNTDTTTNNDTSQPVVDNNTAKKDDTTTEPVKPKKKFLGLSIPVVVIIGVVLVGAIVGVVIYMVKKNKD